MRQHRWLAGHYAGKSFIRRSADFIELKQHFPVDGEGKGISDLVGDSSLQRALLHFFEQVRQSWRAKLHQRMENWGGGRRCCWAITGAALMKSLLRARIL